MLLEKSGHKPETVIIRFANYNPYYGLPFQKQLWIISFNKEKLVGTAYKWHHLHKWLWGAGKDSFFPSVFRVKA